MPAVELHGIEDRFGLEAGRFEGGARDVSALRVLGDAEDCALGVVDPVGRKEAGEGGDKDAAAVVFDCGGEVGDFLRVGDEAHVVHEEFDAGAGNGNGTFECVYGFSTATEVVGYGSE